MYHDINSIMQQMVLWMKHNIHSSSSSSPLHFKKSFLLFSNLHIPLLLLPFLHCLTEGYGDINDDKANVSRCPTHSWWHVMCVCVCSCCFPAHNTLLFAHTSCLMCATKVKSVYPARLSAGRMLTPLYVQAQRSVCVVCVCPHTWGLLQHTVFIEGETRLT